MQQKTERMPWQKTAPPPHGGVLFSRGVLSLSSVALSVAVIVLPFESTLIGPDRTLPLAFYKLKAF